jgi:AcrR family transcriptional regulator
MAGRFLLESPWTPESSTMPRWKQSDLNSDNLFQKKRDTVIREAARTFSAKGYHGTSLDEVAKVLGVTKAALYYYVPSKRDILYECLVIAADIGDEALEEAQRNAPAGLGRLSSFIQGYANRAMGDLGACLLITDMDDLDATRRLDIERRQATLLDGVRALIAETRSTEGRAPRGDATFAARFTLNSLNTLPRWHGQAPGAEATTPMVENLSRLITDGVAASPAHPQ